jgi:hypothetical protein
MGPDLGSREVDKVDLFIFPIVLLLQISLLVLGLLQFSIKIFLQGYNYVFSHGHQQGIYQEISAHGLLHSLFDNQDFDVYIISSPKSFTINPCISIQSMARDLLLAKIILLALHTRARGWSLWLILTDPEDRSSTWRKKLKNLKPKGAICPLYSRFLVFSSYQVYGAYAHLMQANNKEAMESIASASGPSLPKTWDSLQIAISYNYLALVLFEPPDCSLQ